MKKKVFTILQIIFIAILIVMFGIAVRRVALWHEQYIQEHTRHGKVAEELAHMQAEEALRVFDVQAIEKWCASMIEEEGKVRMIHATLDSTEGELTTLVDEAGELWLVDNVTVTDTDNVLLWIHDNDTTDDVTDDVIIKVFIEVRQ